jgi:hypothetical protein
MLRDENNDISVTKLSGGVVKDVVKKIGILQSHTHTEHNLLQTRVKIT